MKCEGAMWMFSDYKVRTSAVGNVCSPLSSLAWSVPCHLSCSVLAPGLPRAGQRIAFALRAAYGGLVWSRRAKPGLRETLLFNPLPASVFQKKSQ